MQEIKEDNTEPTEKVEPSKTSKELLSLEEDDHPHRKYGFDDLFENVFKSFEDCSDVIENPVPDDSTVDPLELMKEMESAKFDADHYLSDYIYGKEDYLYTEFVDIQNPPHFGSFTHTLPPRLGQGRSHHPQAPQERALSAAGSSLFLDGVC